MVRKANFSRLVVVDPQTAGISGDMIVGALVDLGARKDRVLHSFQRLSRNSREFRSVRVIIQKRRSGPVYGTRLEVEGGEIVYHRSGASLEKSLSSALAKLDISSGAKTFAMNSLRTLIEAETRVHGERAERVELHESGSADTIIDLVGAAVAADDLGLFKACRIEGMPVAVGGGLFEFSHGTVQSPGPAILEILRRFRYPLTGGPVAKELATPTGVAMLVNLAGEHREFYPEMSPVKVGYGLGSNKLDGIPNALRLVEGVSHRYREGLERVYVLETNLDDVTGEVLGHAMDRIVRLGARDAFVLPVYTKKQRPAYLFTALADESKLVTLSQALMDETGTLGVRFYRCERFTLHREIRSTRISVEGHRMNVRIKVSYDAQGEIVGLKPEFDDVRRLSGKTGLSLRKVSQRVIDEARKQLGLSV